MCRFFLGILLVTALTSGAYAQKAPMSLLNSSEKAQIVINNRVLAKVNEKPITVLDVVRKMDMVFYKQFPQYASSQEARFQFYDTSWKRVLEEIVDKELIMTDAAQIDMKLSDSDVRKEMEEMFGPNVAVNLDKAGLSCDEAKKLIQDDILLRRMLYMRVHSKALSQVTPADVRREYSSFIDAYERADEWHFRVLTVRDPSPKNLERISSSITQFLNTEKLPVEDIKYSLSKVPGYSPFTSVKVSDLFEQKEIDLSEKYKAPLAALSIDEYSMPIQQYKEGSPSDAIKILYLSDIIVDEYPTFAATAPKLKNKLLEQISEKEGVIYKKKLRKQFPVTIIDFLIASDFKPFTLEKMRH